MFNDKCPLCGCDSYVGLNRTECSQPSCKNYRATVTKKDFTPEEILKIKVGLRDLVKDFAEDVAPLYLKNNWAWAVGGGYIIPGKQDIIGVLNHLIDSVEEFCDGDFLYVGTGRLFIRAYKTDEEIEYFVSLEPEQTGSFISR